MKTLQIGLLTIVFACAARATPFINEFVVDHTGTDADEFIEIFGAPNTDYSGLTVIEIEGDGASAGLIDDLILSVGSTGANGLWFSGFDPGGANDIENGNVTLLLVSGFTGAVGNDIDTNNDGVIDATFWTAIIDSIGTSDGLAGFVYGPDLAPGFDGNSFQPGGASRIPDGTDTDTAADWVRNDFNGYGLPSYPAAAFPASGALNTPNALNALVPEPGVLSLLCLGGILAFRRRR